MKSAIRNIVSLCFPNMSKKYSAYKMLIVNKNSYLHTTGWMSSLMKGMPVDKHGQAVPWMNYPIIEFLSERLNKSLSLFEYGSGYSTSYYSNKVKDVVSVEYDNAWFLKIKETLPGNVLLVFQNEDVDGKYCRAIECQNKEFDVVVVDGRDRVNCIKSAIGYLTKSGVIILDDSSREEYKEGFVIAQSNGFKSISFLGLKATGARIDQTTIFYRENNCFGI